MCEKKLLLTFNEAVAMLPEKEYVHTIRSNGFMLVGADCEKNKLIDMIKESEPEIGGSASLSRGHGLVIIDSYGPLFIETKKNAPEEFEEAQKHLTTCQNQNLQSQTSAIG